MTIASLVSLAVWYVVDIRRGVPSCLLYGEATGILWLAASLALMIAGMFVVMAG